MAERFLGKATVVSVMALGGQRTDENRKRDLRLDRDQSRGKNLFVMCHATVMKYRPTVILMCLNGVFCKY
jgi:hypothetical protein